MDELKTFLKEKWTSVKNWPIQVKISIFLLFVLWCIAFYFIPFLGVYIILLAILWPCIFVLVKYFLP